MVHAGGRGGEPVGRSSCRSRCSACSANKWGRGFAVRGPVLGLFLDLEVRMVQGPVFADHDYELRKTIIGLSQSRRTESYWTETTVTDPATRDLVAVVVLHQGVFKQSYADYPPDRLA